MLAFKQLFQREFGVAIGMIHVKALPGAPLSKLPMEEIVDIACQEASVYEQAGVDGILIENMHDVPYVSSNDLGPETVSAMSVVCAAVRKQVQQLPIGIQVLSGGNRAALAIAKSAGLNFVRAEGFVYSHIGDEGPIHSCAADLMRYRKHIQADDVLVFTDIKKKHSSHAITADVSLASTALAAEMFLSSGVIVTSDATGRPANPDHVNEVQKAVKIPVIVGSGVTTENLPQYANSNAIIVGSHFKLHGQWFNELDPVKVGNFMNKLTSCREESQTVQERRRLPFDLTAQGE